MGIPPTSRLSAPEAPPRGAALRFLHGVALPFLATRIALLLVGMVAVRFLGSGLSGEASVCDACDPVPQWLDIWARWDAAWYLLIAEEGYEAQLAGTIPEPFGSTDTIGFFPLYPLLIRALSRTGISSTLAGVLISNGALLVALVLLAALVRRDFGDRVATRTVWALLAFPTSLFFSAVYAESLLLCCAVGALLMARLKRPLAAGLLGGLCTLTRPVGLLIVIPLFSEMIAAPPASGRHDVGRRMARIAACFLPAAAALTGFMVYGRAVTGSFTAFIERQVRWRGLPSGPWRALQRYFEDPALHDAHHSTVDLVIAVLMLASIPLLFKLLPRSYALYGTAMILAPLGSSLWSFARLAAVVFPVHVALAVATEDRPRWFAIYLAAAFPLSAVFMALYATWRWAG